MECCFEVYSESCFECCLEGCFEVGCLEVVSSVASRDILSVVLRLFGGLFSV